MPGISAPSRTTTWLTAAALLLIAGAIRFHRLGKDYNYIDDLSARHAILTMDITRGIFHFPHAPFIFEFDETGFDFAIAPWIAISGLEWKNFQVISALLGTLMTGVLGLFTGLCFGAEVGLIAMAAAVSLPAFLTWDKFFFMSGSAWLSILDLGALSLLAGRFGNISGVRLVLSAIILAFSTYTVRLTGLVIPAALLFIRYGTSQAPNKNTRFLRSAGIWLAIYGISMAPLYYFLFREPYYILWRSRHFLHFVKAPVTALKSMLENVISVPSDIFLKATFFLHQPPGKPILTWPLFVLFISGIITILTTPRIRSRCAPIFAYILSWYFMMLLLKQESWRGVYVSCVLPFLLAVCGIGGTKLLDMTFGSSPAGKRLFPLILAVLIGYHAVLFLWGDYKIPWRDDILTRLQLDVRNDPDIPHLFSARIPDVYHYHCPFWFVTRSYLSRVSIFDWDDTGTCLSHPDGKPLSLKASSRNPVYFIIRPEDAPAFVRCMKGTNLVVAGFYPRTGLMKFRGNIEVDELLKRTWTLSAVPPIIPSVHSPGREKATHRPKTAPEIK